MPFPFPLPLPLRATACKDFNEVSSSLWDLCHFSAIKIKTIEDELEPYRATSAVPSAVPLAVPSAVLLAAPLPEEPLASAAPFAGLYLAGCGRFTFNLHATAIDNLCFTCSILTSTPSIRTVAWKFNKLFSCRGSCFCNTQATYLDSPSQSSAVSNKFDLLSVAVERQKSFFFPTALDMCCESRV